MIIILLFSLLTCIVIPAIQPDPINERYNNDTFPITVESSPINITITHKLDIPLSSLAKIGGTATILLGAAQLYHNKEADSSAAYLVLLGTAVALASKILEDN